ncbi:MAG: hypothetical protein V1694_08850 [Candidatus Eisenbacteria bacterium]
MRRIRDSRSSATSAAQPWRFTKASLAILVVSAVFAPVTAHADLCWGGHPAPECKTFVVTEAGLGLHLTYGESDNIVPFVDAHLGLMFNRSPNTALGGSLVLRGDWDAARAGVAFRYRRWLTPEVGLDVIPEVLRSDGLNGAIGVGLTYRDIVAATLGTEVVNRRHGGTRLCPYLGVRCGSWASPILVVVQIVGILVYFLSSMSADTW